MTFWTLVLANLVAYLIGLGVLVVVQLLIKGLTAVAEDK